MRCYKRYKVIATGLLLILFLLCVGIFSCVILWNNPYSLLYKYRTFNRDELVSQLLSENQERFNHSKTYLKLAEQSHLKNTVSKVKNELVVGIITVARQYNSYVLGYLTQAVASVHQSLPKETAEIIICNTDPKPAQHSEALNLSKQFLVYDRFKQEGQYILDMAKPNHPRINAGEKFTETENGFLKEKDDYLFCLEKLLQHKSELIVVLEDDAVTIEHFFVDLKHFILPKLTYYYPKWGYVKLYYPPKWQGYANELPRILDLLYTAAWGAVAITLVCSVVKVLTSLRQYRAVNFQSIFALPFKKKWLLVLILVLAFVLCSFFVIVIGRQNVLELQRMFHHYNIIASSGCCTPAILYKPSTATEMVNYLRNVKCTDKYPFDIAQEDFRKNKTVAAYLIEPSLVHHIGLVSAIKGKGLKADLNEFLDVK